MIPMFSKISKGYMTSDMSVHTKRSPRTFSHSEDLEEPEYEYVSDVVSTFQSQWEAPPESPHLPQENPIIRTTKQTSNE